jgi:CDP-glycerol glycerophosphotransferase (TagB/SpsB family)/glycosyltransferase involved in cell wall biosynthesis
VSNGGAGKARNLALDDCSGEFVTILDADDELHPHAVEKLVHDALANGSDVVSAEWVTVNKAKGVKSYGPHFGGRSYARLTQKQKRVLISKTHYAIGKLYLKTYLDRHAIRYGEGHIYEDQQFVVGSTVMADRISVVGQPLYFVNVTETSSTRVSYDNDWHSKSFSTAVKATIDGYGEQLHPYRKGFTTYVMNRVYLYAVTAGRIPRRERFGFTIAVFGELLRLHKGKLNPSDAPFGKRLVLKTFRVNRRLGYWYFYGLKHIESVPAIKRSFVSTEKALRRWSVAALRLRKKFFPALDDALIRRKKRVAKAKADSLPFDDNAIVVHGFDGKMKGNSEYVLGSLVDRGFKVILPLAVHPDDVPAGVTVVKPWSVDHHVWLRKARFHILETWGNVAIGKRPGAVWLQMWHGTPFKKLLFDSSERDLMRKAPNHKLVKMRDVVRWDYVLAQNAFCAEKLSSSFSLEPSSVKNFGYPRTDVLTGTALPKVAKAIRQKYGVKDDKKVLLYATTWRDYNQYNIKKDNGYLFDWESVPEFLDEYHVLYCGHPFGKDAPPTGMTVTKDDDFQHLLMASDALITDYSSAAFDFLVLDRPFCFFTKDLEKFEASRGVYPEIMEDFRSFVAMDEVAAVEIIGSYPGINAIENKEKYLFSEDGQSGVRLAEFLLGVKADITTQQREIDAVQI